MERVIGRPRKVLTALLVGMLLVSVVWMVPATHAATANAVLVSYKAGLVVQIRGHEFRATELVVGWITGPDNTVYGVTTRTRADRATNVAVNVLTSRFWPLGWWAVTLHGVDSGAEAIATFQLTLPAQDGFLDVEPAIVRQGGRINFHGAFFATDEKVMLWATQPDGIVVPIDEHGLTAKDGEIRFAVDVPATWMLGIWHMSAIGRTSERLLEVPFTVTNY